MWFYDTIAREEFEKKKIFVEGTMLELGAKKFEILLPYEQKTTSKLGKINETFYSQRNIYSYKDNYFRVDEVLFNQKPFIVLEYGTLQDLLNNTMEDADPFPYDLSEEQIKNEVKQTLEIE